MCLHVCVCTTWGGVDWEVSVGRVMTPPPLEGSGPAHLWDITFING